MKYRWYLVVVACFFLSNESLATDLSAVGLEVNQIQSISSPSVSYSVAPLMGLELANGAPLNFEYELFVNGGSAGTLALAKDEDDWVFLCAPTEGPPCNGSCEWEGYGGTCDKHTCGCALDADVSLAAFFVVSLSPGDVLVLQLDTQSQVAESDETNNSFQMTFGQDVPASGEQGLLLLGFLIAAAGVCSIVAMRTRIFGSVRNE